jgi:hypothetical protein
MPKRKLNLELSNQDKMVRLKFALFCKIWVVLKKTGGLGLFRLNKFSMNEFICCWCTW